jgi:tripeptidyl-peptidase-1
MLYQIPPAINAHQDNSFGIYEIGQSGSGEMLDRFFANYTPRIPAGTRPEQYNIDGGNPNFFPEGGESGNKSCDLFWFYHRLTPSIDLDFQIAYPIVYPLNPTLLESDDYYWAQYSQGYLNDFLDSIDGVIYNNIPFRRSKADSELVILFFYSLWRNRKRSQHGSSVS